MDMLSSVNLSEDIYEENRVSNRPREIVTKDLSPWTEHMFAHVVGLDVHQRQGGISIWASGEVTQTRAHTAENRVGRDFGVLVAQTVEPNTSGSEAGYNMGDMEMTRRVTQSLTGVESKESGVIEAENVVKGCEYPFSSTRDPSEIESSSPGKVANVYMNSCDRHDIVYAGSCIAADIFGVGFERLQDTFKECQELKIVADDINGKNCGVKNSIALAVDKAQVPDINEFGKGKDIMEVADSLEQLRAVTRSNRLHNLGQEDTTVKQGEDGTKKSFETDLPGTDLIGKYTETALRKLQEADEDI
ncbi:hypothetical protein CHS0354_012956 [Potamilus streckersoni]|uniref:Uncharacterized protein n=1 Tax=Potamilus streckersoni TaxID=2493646 RepID=A0AAE0VY39_9BIVA|nr:hypothetical protein CHS0354_012956 [Potamilus streckersoni]